MKTNIILKIVFIAIGILSTVLLEAQKPFSFTDPKTHTIKIDVDVHNNLVLIPLSINGSAPMFFILDTGVKTTILTEPLLTELLALSNLGRIRVLGLGEGEVIEAALARSVSVGFGADTYAQSTKLIILPEGVASFSGLFGKPVVGIIGHDLFRSFVVEINYYKKYIRLTHPDFYTPSHKAQSLPIVLKNGKPYIDAQLVNEQGDSLKLNWLIDTGASQALSIYHPSVPLPEQNLNAFIGRGLSGNMEGQIGRVGGFMLGKYRFDDIVAGFPSRESIRWALRRGSTYANIGAEIFARFTVTFDYQHFKIYLRKNPRFRRSFTYNTSGLEAIAEGVHFDQFYLIWVRPGSEAEKAGIQVDDQILMINGLDVSEMDLGEVQNRLNPDVGRKLYLKLLREGEKIKVKFKLLKGI